MTTFPAFAPDLDALTIRHLTRPQTWNGLSGMTVTGEAVAAHLQAVAALMERENWDPQVHTRTSRRNLYYALLNTADDGLGDDDTHHVAEDLLACVLAAATGAPYVDYETWNAHPARTLNDVLSACQAAATVASTYGPGPLVDHPQVDPGQNR
ncbi:hypothetical protein [Streptomyces sp. NPDC001930]|uniref:DUF6197 family protein n=1 Tax=Streptomyces sp. NPDC001930 TaxID=3364625 RepID=UPI003689E6A3